MKEDKRDLIISEVKRYFYLKSPQEKAIFLIEVINDLFNMHPAERDGDYYSEEWSNQIEKLINALGFFIKNNSDKNKKLLDYKNKLSAIQDKHNDLLNKLEKTKADLDHAEKKVEGVIDQNRTWEENLQICRALDKISLTIRDLPVIKERSKECSIVASIDSDIENILTDAPELHNEIKQKLDHLENIIREYVNNREDEIKTIKKEIGR